MGKLIAVTAVKNLRENGIIFEEKNEGNHLVVEGTKGFIDYWPTTGKWIARGSATRGPIEGFGSRQLVSKILSESI